MHSGQRCQSGRILECVYFERLVWWAPTGDHIFSPVNSGRCGFGPAHPVRGWHEGALATAIAKTARQFPEICDSSVRPDVDNNGSRRSSNDLLPRTPPTALLNSLIIQSSIIRVFTVFSLFGECDRYTFHNFTVQKINVVFFIVSRYYSVSYHCHSKGWPQMDR